MKLQKIKTFDLYLNLLPLTTWIFRRLNTSLSFSLITRQQFTHQVDARTFYIWVNFATEKKGTNSMYLYDNLLVKNSLYTLYTIYAL